MTALGGYLELTKPRLTLMALATAFLGFFMAARTPAQPLFGPLLFHTLAASALLGGGVNALNQYLERHADSKMKRTESRPIPSGRIASQNALVFGAVLTITGIAYLYLAVNFLSGCLGALTAVSYVFWYTPLKTKTPLNTLVGALPGALPIILGWAAGQNALPAESWTLFLILFFWQLPHFFAIAWLHRQDYDSGGFRMLTLTDKDGRRTGQKIIITSVFLFLATLLPAAAGLTHRIYLLTIVPTGLLFIGCAVSFHRSKLTGARQFVFLTIANLSFIITAMIADRIL